MDPSSGPALFGSEDLPRQAGAGFRSVIFVWENSDPRRGGAAGRSRVWLGAAFGSFACRASRRLIPGARRRPRCAGGPLDGAGGAGDDMRWVQSDGMHWRQNTRPMCAWGAWRRRCVFARGFAEAPRRYGPSGSGRAGPRQRRVEPRQTDARICGSVRRTRSGRLYCRGLLETESSMSMNRIKEASLSGTTPVQSISRHARPRSEERMPG